jgi:hypothetical protein
MIVLLLGSFGFLLGFFGGLLGFFGFLLLGFDTLLVDTVFYLFYNSCHGFSVLSLD